MESYGRVLLAVTALAILTALAVVMFGRGEPATAIGGTILAITVGVQQVVKSLDGLGRRTAPSVPGGSSRAEPEGDVTVAAVADEIEVPDK